MSLRPLALSRIQKAKMRLSYVPSFSSCSLRCQTKRSTVACLSSLPKFAEKWCMSLARGNSESQNEPGHGRRAERVCNSKDAIDGDMWKDDGVDGKQRIKSSLAPRLLCGITLLLFSGHSKRNRGTSHVCAASSRSKTCDLSIYVQLCLLSYFDRTKNERPYRECLSSCSTTQTSTHVFYGVARCYRNDDDDGTCETRTFLGVKCDG
jgi:hypothetical protein